MARNLSRECDDFVTVGVVFFVRSERAGSDLGFLFLGGLHSESDELS